MTASRKDGSRWALRHELYKQDGVKAAVIKVEGAWMDVLKRKLTVLPEELPRSVDYVELEG